MANKHIISIDQSTSSTKAILFDNKGKLKDKSNYDHQQFYPQSGWVEHDPVEILTNTIKAIKSLLQKNNGLKNKIEGVSITNQRETIVIWDKRTGKPVYNAIVWQCQRGKDICNNFKQKGYEEIVKEKTGLLLDPYFSASKIKWILDNVEGVRQQAEKGNLLLGTIDSWLVWNLSEINNHYTDYSNASRTLIYNINKLKWDQKLLKIFGIPESMLPEVKHADEIFGYTDINGVLEDKVPISGVLGDSQAALFGQNCYQKGEAKSTYGTGSSIMMNIGKEYMKIGKGLVTSLAWGKDKTVEYVLEGNVHSSAATIRWLVDKMQIIDSPEESEELARSIDDNGGVYLVPAFVGLGAPYWNNDAKAIINGLTFNSGKEQIVRAGLEAIAYQIKDVLDIMISESGIRLKELRADGGACRNNFLMQFQADMLDVPVKTTAVKEISALGAAYMAGLAINIWSDLNEIKSLRTEARIYNAQMEKEKKDKYYQGWKKAVEHALYNTPPLQGVNLR